VTPDTAVATFRERLTKLAIPQRGTKQQCAVVRYVFTQANPVDADHLIAQLKNVGVRISRATVFRAIQKLMTVGLVRKIQSPGMVFEHD
jgi:Fe2+ or Zn2+ uptake regulation protein